jgi:transposase-like protein
VHIQRVLVEKSPGRLGDLRNRGVRDILIACCDGLAGFEDRAASSVGAV